MTESEALVIVVDLAQGTDPITGHALPASSLYLHPEILQALDLAASALAKIEERQQREQSLPPQAGRPWSAVEDQQLCDAFDRKVPVNQLTHVHHRTTGAIKSRLAKLGKLVPPPA